METTRHLKKRINALTKRKEGVWGQFCVLVHTYAGSEIYGIFKSVKALHANTKEPCINLIQSKKVK